ncbi:MAG: ATP-binding protein [Fermentimonas sp.]
MSKVNVQGVMSNIRSNTTNVYTPIIEAIVNSIQAITEKGIKNGKIDIILHREEMLEVGIIPNVISVDIIDNGIGFCNNNLESFDIIYSDYKKDIGGKGFGRFMFPYYFNDVYIESVFENSSKEFIKRTFKFGTGLEIVTNLKEELINSIKTYSKLSLKNLKNKYSLDKTLDTISKKILEKILIYLIDEDFNCPTIVIREADDENEYRVINDFLTKTDEIVFVGDNSFTLQNNENKVEFFAKTFKIYFAGSQKSKIILTAHQREVTDTSLYKYVPEFEDDFYEENLETGSKKNYIIKTYITGEYLDKNVSLERDMFDFPKETPNMLYPFSQVDIERGASEIPKKIFSDDVNIRSEKKFKEIKHYVTYSAPWHRPYLKDLDLTDIPYNLSDEDIELHLQKAKYNKETTTRKELKEYLTSTEDDFDEKVTNAISKISEIGKSDLAHYVFNRKCILDTLRELLKRREDGKGELEKEIHNLIFPMGGDSEKTHYDKHNLWLLDERLVFTEYIASDRKIGTKNDALREPDLVIFDQKKSFRAGDNSFSNPLTIFEFKRPKRETYREEDDPILQISKYLKDIRDNMYDMPEGLEKIKVNDSTPVYGYVICDITDRIKDFAQKYQLTLSADGEGYFGYHSGYKMYIEIMSYKKLIDDATLRNKVFFNKLQID